MRTLRSPLILLAPWLCACAGGDRTETAVVRDSAGIRIVENAAPGWSDGRGWTLSPESVVRIGAVEGDPAYQFDGIMGVRLLSDRRIVVGNMGTAELRIYDAAGVHEVTAGRRGAGPGEFRQVMGVVVLPGDTILVLDRFDRAQLFDPRGEFAALVMPRDFLSDRAWIHGAFADGALVLTRTHQPDDALRAPQSVSSTLFAVPREARSDAGSRRSPPAADSLLHIPIIRMVPGFRGMPTPVEFAGLVHVALAPDGIYSADSENFEVRSYDRSGRLTGIFRRAWSPIPVTQDHIDRHSAHVVDGPGEDGQPVPERLRQQRIEIMAASTFASHFPAFDQALADRGGNLWLRGYDPDDLMQRTVFNPSPSRPRRWTVFSRDGVWLGEVEMPARFVVMDIGEDYVAGVMRDELDVEYVHVYALRKD